MKDRFKQIIIHPEVSLLLALKRMHETERKLLLVFDNDKYVGLLSIGDIQRAIIKNVCLNSFVSTILQIEGRIVAGPEDSITEIKKLMLENRTEFMPLVGSEGQLLNVYFWEDLFVEKKPEVLARFNLPVAIMAGGFGQRLKPLTNVLPKPLIPIGSKTMLEEIFDRFAKYGSKRFFISVNYKAELIKYYINSLGLEYDITYFMEDSPSGTAGSLSLLKGRINETFFVTNCDNLIEQDYSQILNYHRNNRNEITIVAAVKHFPIAYGTIETGENGHLIELTEKPELIFKINSGMYILEPGLLEEIPEDRLFNITDLIGRLQDQKRRIGVFPVWHTCWVDIGDWTEYMSIIRTYRD